MHLRAPLIWWYEHEACAFGCEASDGAAGVAPSTASAASAAMVLLRICESSPGRRSIELVALSASDGRPKGSLRIRCLLLVRRRRVHHQRPPPLAHGEAACSLEA